MDGFVAVPHITVHLIHPVHGKADVSGKIDVTIPQRPHASEPTELGVAGIGRPHRKRRPDMIRRRLAVVERVVNQSPHVVQWGAVAGVLVVEPRALHPVRDLLADVILPAGVRRRRVAGIPGAIQERNRQPMTVIRRGHGPGPALVQVVYVHPLWKRPRADPIEPALRTFRQHVAPTGRHPRPLGGGRNR